MKNLKKSMRKTKRRKTNKRRKTYKGGAAAAETRVKYDQAETFLHLLFTTTSISKFAFFLSNDKELFDQITELIISEKFVVSKDINKPQMILDLLFKHGIIINKYFTPESLKGIVPTNEDFLANSVEVHMSNAQEILYKLFTDKAKDKLAQYLNHEIISVINKNLDGKDARGKKELILSVFKKNNITVSNETFMPTRIESAQMAELLLAQNNNNSKPKLYALANQIFTELGIINTNYFVIVNLRELAIQSQAY